MESRIGKEWKWVRQNKKKSNGSQMAEMVNGTITEYRWLDVKARGATAVWMEQ